MKKRLLKIVNTGRINPGIDVAKGVFAVNKAQIDDIDSKVIIHSQDYEKIFGTKKKNLPVYRKKLCIVKITSKTGYTIHRECVAHPLNTERCAAVSKRSLAMLNLEDENKPLVDITKGSWWSFYWNHPIHATRISTRLGVLGICVSILVTLISVIVTTK